MRYLIETICILSAGYLLVFLLSIIICLLVGNEPAASRFFVAFLVVFCTLIGAGSIHKGLYK